MFLLGKKYTAKRSLTMSLASELSKNLNFLHLLARYGLLEIFLIEVLKDEKNKEIALSTQRQEALLRDFKYKNEIDNPRKMKEYCRTHLLSENDLKYSIEKEERTKNYCNKYFSPDIETKSLSQNKIDETVSYSLLRVSEEGLANELYLQLTEENANLKDLINKYSEGPEKKSDGIIGPSPITKSHPILVKQLRSAKQGQLLKPFKIENWWLIVRLESFEPVSVDGFITANKSYELYQNWLSSEALKLRLSIKDGVDDESNFYSGETIL